MKKQSPVSHKFSEAEYEFGDINDYLVPLSKRDASSEERNNNPLCLFDLSSLNRIGFRGANIVQWLIDQHNLDVPEINRATLIEQELLIARLSQTEIMILQDVSDTSSSFSKVIDKTGTDALSDKYPGIYYLPRQDSHACFLLKGEQCAELLSKLCAVDLSIYKFANMSIVQTSMARTSVIIIRRDLTGIQGYIVLVDTSLAYYLWDCLLDAMQEFNGCVPGYNAIKSSIY